MEVSFIIPVYNRAKLVCKTVDSIKNSSGLEDYEIIIVDDNSSDNTIQILKKRYSKLKFVENKFNKGPAVCRNQGIQASKGKYLFLIDSDVFLKKNCFEKLFKAIQGYDIAFPTINFEDETRMYPSNENEQEFLKAATVFMIKKDSLKKLDELFDPNYYMVEEDTDFFMRCKFFGLKCHYVKNATAYHVLESNLSLNLEKKYYLTAKNHIYSWLKFSKTDPEIIKSFGFPSTKLILKDLVMAFFNINLLSITSVEGRTKIKRSYWNKIKMLLGHHQKIVPRNRLLLMFLFSKAIIWNTRNIKRTFKKRRNIKAKLIQ